MKKNQYRELQLNLREKASVFCSFVHVWEMKILIMKSGGMSLVEIGRELKISRGRVAQIYNRACFRLKKAVEAYNRVSEINVEKVILREDSVIKIQPSETADTRTCDVSKVTREQLKKSSYQHIADVRAALAYFQKKLQEAGEWHDHTKLDGLEQFYSDFKTGFKTTIWWDQHRVDERHHIGQADGVREDIDLIDVLEFIADCVMAGMGRAGSVYDLKIDDAVLQKAFKNTTDKLKAQVFVDK